MTSKLTREQLHERARENVKALKMASRQTAFESAREEILADLQLAELALAAMDSEPVAAAGNGPSPALSLTQVQIDWICNTCATIYHTANDDVAQGYIDEIRATLERMKSIDTAQPAPEYPETLPCPVLLEPGLRFGKGIKTSTMLAALARRDVYESDLAALSPEERAEFQVGIEDVKALIAQSTPVMPDGYVMVPKDLLSELRDLAHPEIEKYCEMWEGRRDSEFPALRKVITDADALLAAAPQEVKGE